MRWRKKGKEEKLIFISDRLRQRRRDFSPRPCVRECRIRDFHPSLGNSAAAAAGEGGGGTRERNEAKVTVQTAEGEDGISRGREFRKCILSSVPNTAMQQ